MSTWDRCDPRRAPSSTAWATPEPEVRLLGGPPASDSRVSPGGPVPGRTCARRRGDGAGHAVPGSPGPTVRDACGCTRGSAAPGGDVPGTDEVSVAPVPAVRAGEPASPRPGDGPVALRAGRGRPPLVHEHDPDPGQLRLVRKAPQQVGAPPVAQRQVLAPAAVSCRDAPGVPTTTVPTS